MSPSQKVDLSRWVFTYYLPEDGLKIVPLETGAWFPEALQVTGRYKSGPLLIMSFKVQDGRPILTSLTIGQEEDQGGPVTPSAVHDLPLGQLLDDTIGGMAEAMQLFHPSAEHLEAGLPARFPGPGKLAEARRAGIESQRGRPVTDDILRKVAEIVKANSYAPRVKIRDELGASPRTASRWIDKARERGFLTEEN